MSRDHKIAVVLYVVCTALYAITAGPRLRHPSTDTHFVWMAESWLQGRLDLGRTPPHGNDWAEVEYLTLRDGSRIAGAFQRMVAGRFRTLDGQMRYIPEAEIVHREKRYYVSFPPMPAVLLLPAVAVLGHRTNDVLFNVLVAGLVPSLMFLVLRRLRRHLPRGSEDPSGDLSADLWLCLLLAFGSVLYFASVLGQVWYTAHLVSLVFAGLFLLCVLPLRWPTLAGVCLGALMLTRPQMVFFGVLLVAGALAQGHEDGRWWPPRWDRWREILSPLLRAGVPFLLLAAAGFAYNHARFRSWLEFGHSYLTTMQADNIQRYGLFNYQYLPRNLAAAFTLLPKLLPRPPYVQISYHGLSLLFTTPALAYLVRPPANLDDKRRWLRTVLWLSVLPIALFGLLYQNDGYIQFGYRFSLDYMLLLVLILAVSNQADLRRWTFRGLVLWGVVVNLFGAVTFGRMWQFYYNGFFPVP